jgi:Tfp pilus assembly protein PilN
MITINLAPDQARRGGGGFRLRLPRPGLGLAFAVLYVAAAAGIGGYWWVLHTDEQRLAAEVDRDTRELAALKPVIGQADRVRGQVAELKKRVKVIEDLTRGQSRPILLLDAFADVIPRDLWITGLEEKGTTLKLSGSAFSTTAVADFMANLRSSGRFKDVDIVISKQDLAKPPRLVTFEVTCRFEG